MGRQPRATRTVTMTDIARACGLSHATVSFVLRHRLDRALQRATRERVFAAAVRLGYQPPRHQRLEAAKLRVLFICPEFDVAYGKASYPGRVMAELARRQRDSAVHVVLAATERQSMMETLYRGVCEEHAQAVIVTRLAATELAAVVAQCPVPVIHLGPRAAGRGLTVAMDDAGVGRAAAAHLWERGHRQALLLGVPGSPGAERTAAFVRAWRRRGGAAPTVWLGEFHESFGQAAAQRYMLLAEPQPTAIFAVSDSICYGFLQTVHAAGRTVPDYVSLVGCDDLPGSAWSCPPLTTFALPTAAAAEHLLRLVRGACLGDASIPAQVTLPAQLMPRASVRLLPVLPAP